MTANGYRSYNPEKKVFHSRDVILNEQKYGFKEPFQTQKEPQLLVYLKRSDEPLETVEPSILAVRRSERERRQTNFYGFWYNLSDVRAKVC